MVNKHQNMQNEDITKIIDNLKGRKNYEQKKAAEDLKIKELEEASKATKKIKKDSKSCTCC